MNDDIIITKILIVLFIVLGNLNNRLLSVDEDLVVYLTTKSSLSCVSVSLLPLLAIALTSNMGFNSYNIHNYIYMYMYIVYVHVYMPVPQAHPREYNSVFYICIQTQF